MTRVDFKVWGRRNSVNVQKVLWCCSELDLEFERIDAGMEFGRNNEPAYLAMNPNGRIPTLVEGDFVLWESNAIMRYLALKYGGVPALYPDDAQIRAGVERWLDWTLTTIQPAERLVFWGLIRTPAAQRDMRAIQDAADAVAVHWRILDAHLSDRSFLEGGQFTLADLAMATYARRWFGVTGINKPELPNLERWYGQFSDRRGFQQYVAPPLS